MLRFDGVLNSGVWHCKPLYVGVILSNINEEHVWIWLQTTPILVWTFVVPRGGSVVSPSLAGLALFDTWHAGPPLVYFSVDPSVIHIPLLTFIEPPSAGANCVFKLRGIALGTNSVVVLVVSALTLWLSLDVCTPPFGALVGGPMVVPSISHPDASSHALKASNMSTGSVWP